MERRICKASSKWKALVLELAACQKGFQVHFTAAASAHQLIEEGQTATDGKIDPA